MTTTPGPGPLHGATPYGAHHATPHLKPQQGPQHPCTKGAPPRTLRALASECLRRPNRATGSATPLQQGVLHPAGPPNDPCDSAEVSPSCFGCGEATGEGNLFHDAACFARWREARKVVAFDLERREKLRAALQASACSACGGTSWRLLNAQGDLGCESCFPEAMP